MNKPVLSRRSFLQDPRIGGVVQSSRVHVPCGTTWYGSPTIDCLTLVRRFDLCDSAKTAGNNRIVRAVDRRD